MAPLAHPVEGTRAILGDGRAGSSATSCLPAWRVSPAAGFPGNHGRDCSNLALQANSQETFSPRPVSPRIRGALSSRSNGVSVRRRYSSTGAQGPTASDGDSPAARVLDATDQGLESRSKSGVNGIFDEVSRTSNGAGQAKQASPVTDPGTNGALLQDGIFDEVSRTSNGALGAEDAADSSQPVSSGIAREGESPPEGEADNSSSKDGQCHPEGETDSFSSRDVQWPTEAQRDSSRLEHRDHEVGHVDLSSLDQIPTGIGVPRQQGYPPPAPAPSSPWQPRLVSNGAGAAERPLTPDASPAIDLPSPGRSAAHDAVPLGTASDSASASASDSESDSASAFASASESASASASASSQSPRKRRRRRLGLVLAVRKLLGALAAVLPGGSWWQIGMKQEGPQGERMARSLVQLWGFAKKDTGMLALATVFLALAALSEVAIPHYLAATIFNASNGATLKFQHTSRMLIVMTVSCGVFSGLRAACFGVLNLNMVRRMRSTLFENVLSQDIEFFDRESVGELTSRLGSDCQSVSQIISVDLNIILRNMLQGLGAFVFLVRLSWRMTLVTMALCGLMWYCLMVYGRFQREIAKVLQDTVASANEVAEESFSLARVVRTFGTEQREVARYLGPLGRLVEIGRRRTAAYSMWASGGLTIYNAAQVAAVVGGGAAVMAKSITPEELTKFILYAEWVVHATWWVGDHWASLMEAVGSCDRVFRLLDLPKAPQLAAQGGRVLERVQGRIEFRNVSFSYPTRPTVPVLNDVSLCINPGELVALVGLSGSGKSTLVGLLLRLYEPTQGQVLLDGVPLTELDVGWYRKQMGVVSQEPRLFSTDIAANIAYGSSTELSPEQIRAAAQLAYADEFVSRLPEGYDTVVDNARLSGGQKQRIAIARALVRDPSILILDEATSALDAESEYNVQRALDGAMTNGAAPGGAKRKRSVLVIAHRLSTVRNADRIVVMSSGRIIEMGTHDELMVLEGEYARLNARQMDTLSEDSSL